MKCADVGTLDAKTLRDVLHYDRKTGVFMWLLSGTIAGYLEPKTGYNRIKVGGRQYMAHRLAWLYVHGSWPTNRIDHRNGIRSDNRFDNLREASDRDNSRNQRVRRNNRLGIAGVRLHEGGKYQVRLFDGERFRTSTHETLEEAIAERRQRCDRIFGEFARV